MNIWFWNESYIRFAAHDFSLEDSTLKNKLTHLTNQAVTCKWENFKNNEIEGCMWSMKQMIDYLKKTTG